MEISWMCRLSTLVVCSLPTPSVSSNSTTIWVSLTPYYSIHPFPFRFPSPSNNSSSTPCSSSYIHQAPEYHSVSYWAMCSPLVSHRKACISSLFLRNCSGLWTLGSSLGPTKRNCPCPPQWPIYSASPSMSPRWNSLRKHSGWWWDAARCFRSVFYGFWYGGVSSLRCLQCCISLRTVGESSWSCINCGARFIWIERRNKVWLRFVSWIGAWLRLGR